MVVKRAIKTNVGMRRCGWSAGLHGPTALQEWAGREQWARYVRRAVMLMLSRLVDTPLMPADGVGLLWRAPAHSVMTIRNNAQSASPSQHWRRWRQTFSRSKGPGYEEPYQRWLSPRTHGDQTARSENFSARSSCPIIMHRRSSKVRKQMLDWACCYLLFDDGNHKDIHLVGKLKV